MFHARVLTLAGIGVPPMRKRGAARDRRREESRPAARGTVSTERYKSIVEKSARVAQARSSGSTQETAP